MLLVTQIRERSDGHARTALWERKITVPKDVIHNWPAPPTWLCRRKQLSYLGIIWWQIRQQPTLPLLYWHNIYRLTSSSYNLFSRSDVEFCHPAHLAWKKNKPAVLPVPEPVVFRLRASQMTSTTFPWRQLAVLPRHVVEQRLISPSFCHFDFQQINTCLLPHSQVFCCHLWTLKSVK